MITRSKCKEIARDWVFAKAFEESQRRMLDSHRWTPLSTSPLSDSEAFKAYLKQERALSRLCAEMLLTGGYDPPAPRIPGPFARLRMNDWTPPEPTKSDWPMCTAEETQSV